MRVEAKLREDRIPAINLVDLASADLSDKFLSISRFYKQESDTEKNEKFDFVLLNLKEARELQSFLNQNLKETA